MKDICPKGAGLSLKTATSSTMSEIKQITVPCLDLDCLLSAKVKLRQDGCLDPALKATLEHAMQTLLPLPVAKRKDVSLLLEGERQLVRFVAGTPALHYTVRLAAGGPEVHQRVLVPGARLTPSCISDSHFAGHRCWDELEGCAERARRAARGAVPAGNHGNHGNHGNDSPAEAGGEPAGTVGAELRIVCGELRLTYAPSQQVRASVEIQPRPRFCLGHGSILERLLEVKSQLESHGSLGPELLRCFQHVLLHHDQYQAGDLRLLLQGDGQTVELLCGGCHDYHSTVHFVFTDADGKAQSQKVQDMDMWDYD